MHGGTYNEEEKTYTHVDGVKYIVEKYYEMSINSLCDSLCGSEKDFYSLIHFIIELIGVFNNYFPEKNGKFKIWFFKDPISGKETFSVLSMIKNENGESALDYLRKHFPDIEFMDGNNG